MKGLWGTLARELLASADHLPEAQLIKGLGYHVCVPSHRGTPASA